MVNILLSGGSLPLIIGLGLLLTQLRGVTPWKIARYTVHAGLLGMLLTVVAALIGHYRYGASIDLLALMMSSLIALLGWVIVRFSERYLTGEPAQASFVKAMLLTLVAVSVLVISRHLLVMVMAWSVTSFSLQRLLLFYSDRRAARIVAHKRFLIARLAEICLFSALAMIYLASSTLSLDGLSDWLAGQSELPVAVHFAAALIVTAVILNAAQLPLHGWLIQVMEAPTPVSALLHAGVVNIGGYVLIRLADLISLVPVAQAMLVLVGGLSAVLAGLVMMTRISIKVRLAWSTCAQMGFMLMEIGLGLYALALLHLLAHSVYKAHAFLTSGERVDDARLQALFSQRQSRQPVGWYLLVPLLSLLIVQGSVIGLAALGFSVSLPLDAMVIVALALSALLWFEQPSVPVIVQGLLSAVGLSLGYLFWHELFSLIIPVSAHASSGLISLVVVMFSVLYGVQVWVRCYPTGRLAGGLYPWAYHGFYLDEGFTRLAFRLWPVRFSKVQARPVNRQIPIQYGETL